MTSLDDVAELISRDHGLAVVTTLRPDGAITASVVNAGVLPHPVTGDPVVAFVSGGDAQRLERLRREDTIIVVLRAGRQMGRRRGPRRPGRADRPPRQYCPGPAGQPAP